jgi:hypothetical protein
MTDPSPVTTAAGATGPPRLEFTAADGTPVRCEVEPAADDQPPPGGLLRTRQVLVVSSSDPDVVRPGGRLLHKRVPHRPRSGDWRADDMLDNEIGAGLRLFRRYGAAGYPPELSRLVGYQLDDDQPYVLLEPYAGEAVSDTTVPLLLEDELRFEVGLFRALRFLAAAGLVHGRISPDSVRWDRAAGRTQLVDLTGARLIGERRPPGGEPPWCSPECRAGTGTTDARDDVWGAGLLVFHVATGVRVDGQPGAPDVAARGPALRSLLDHVFGAVSTRPDARDLLARLDEPDPLRSAVDRADPRFEEGRRLFQDLSRQKHPWLAPPPEPLQQPPPPPRATATPPGPRTGTVRASRPPRRPARGYRVAVLALVIFVVVAAVAALLLGALT